jgi:hypothetical protein
MAGGPGAFAGSEAFEEAWGVSALRGDHRGGGGLLGQLEVSAEAHSPPDAVSPARCIAGRCPQATVIGGWRPVDVPGPPLAGRPPT